MNRFLILLLLFSTITHSESAHKALYIYGHEVNTLTLCDQPDRELWVMGDDLLLERLQEHYYQHSDKPYQAIPLLIKGAIEPKAQDGFASEYDGQFRLEQWHKSVGGCE